ncbi:protamine-like protein [Platichthys flesus]|uniref:protamine-like protein n=1 Tax=Platichthys flesus TaxID=8260 RepID=UPI002DC05238|nr:protamine-like protein [Platichthys flesus]
MTSRSPRRSRSTMRSKSPKMIAKTPKTRAKSPMRSKSTMRSRIPRISRSLMRSNSPMKCKSPKRRVKILKMTSMSPRRSRSQMRSKSPKMRAKTPKTRAKSPRRSRSPRRSKSPKMRAKTPKRRAKSQRKKSCFSVSNLILEGVSASTERHGMSLVALKKALQAGGYDVARNDARVLLTIRRLVANKALVQNKGTSGPFKVNKNTPKTRAKSVWKLAYCTLFWND